MKRFCLLTLLLIVLALAGIVVRAQDGAASGAEVLTNEKVIAMIKANLSTPIIVSKIRASRTKFDVSTEELIRLKVTQVPDDIVNAMVEASTVAPVGSPAGTAISRTDPNDPMAVHEAGIYLFEEKDGMKLMTQLEPSVSTQSKSGGFFKSAMTYGLAKIKSKAVISNPNAKLQIANPRPIFYFYFEVRNSGLSNSGNVYASSTSPNEFVLVKMDVKKKERQLVVGQFNVFGGESGTLDKYARQFDYEKIAPGVYKVTPKAELADGEYGFFYGGSAPIADYGFLGGAGMSPKIFDFGIKAPR